MRTLWCYWIDRHLARIEQQYSSWATTAKTNLQNVNQIPGVSQQESTDANTSVTQFMNNGGGASATDTTFPKNPAAVQGQASVYERLSRDPSDQPRRWIQREYADHEGNTVILGKVAAANESQFYRPEDGEAYRLQVHSTTPIQPEELNKLYQYFCFDLSKLPFLEIYSYNPPDGLACVEHQRREVAHRKRLQAEQREGEYDQPLPPLIPTMRTGFNDQFIPATELQTFAEWGISVNPEIRDINVNITTDQSEMGFDIKELFRGIYSTYVYGQIDYGLREPPPPALSEETPTLQHIQEVLEQQQQTAEVQSVDSNLLRLTLGHEKNIVTVTNNSSDGKRDLQYLIYVQFLANIEQEKTALRETTAHENLFDPNREKLDHFYLQTKSKPESDITSECIFGESICRGSIGEFVKSCAQPNGNPLTIFTQSQDTNPEQNELSGYRYRKVVVSGMPFV
ncbi:hypothetical protein N7499_012099 [Penicillium canescens]|nr:hypothetical protein N7499_012099 [Penicillium canescens]KAJ6175349.1 hypothetical protein N7485_002263 [Penicillium canescens]